MAQPEVASLEIFRQRQDRLYQAERFWQLGIGSDSGFFTQYGGFERYLKSIPPIPEDLLAYDDVYPLLVLVDPRLDLPWLCAQAKIGFEGDCARFIEYDELHREFTEPTWMRVHTGRPNLNRSAHDCRAHPDRLERVLTSLQGICTFIHHPEAVTDLSRPDGFIMDLSGSVDRRWDGSTACLTVLRGRGKLHSRSGSQASNCGSAARTISQTR